ncbi:phosphoglycolate phosphatase/pyrophosphatase PpaX [Paenibacillus taihuensis]|uniref:Phosphoglycolate phosphatase/pyrophosphatase PpaX n=1 Tax=Paenibacillus taihuensis TaxID=1156355 RepID=A0A3D9RV40_9BACL|nr:HAD family hydrolase [Paenibacillus taihuensis]REE83853.1 phosphoglycolate phosphatase/pyrophosphatase PpaX [Paenibacillus taihuensis]
MHTPTRTVLFDFDGTLADTLPLSFRGFQAVFAQYDNRTVSEDEIIAMFGPTEDDIIARNLINQAAVQEATALYYELYRNGHFGSDDVGPLPSEIVHMLAELREKGMKIGVITGKSKKAFLISAEALQLASFFDVVITGDDVEQPKPHPEGIFKALHILGADKDESVFLGDSNADIRAGRAAGLPTYGVQWLSTYQSTNFEIEPDLIFRDVRSFLELIHSKS